MDFRDRGRGRQDRLSWPTDREMWEPKKINVEAKSDGLGPARLLSEALSQKAKQEPARWLNE